MILLSAIALAVSSSCGRLARHEYTQVHMGVPVRVVLYAPDGATASRAARAAFARIAELDAALSDYRATSEVSRLADRAGEAVAVSEDLYAVLALALRLARESEGAFDPTIGPLTDLWRGARRSRTLPDAEALQRARGLVAWEKVSLDSATRTARLAVQGMRLDLGGIAKGYALDRALATLEREGTSRALVEAGGDIVVGDPPPGRRGWRIDVPGAAGEVARRALALANAAVATSGDVEQHVVIDGVRYSHVVDPETGLGLTGGLGATVIAPTGALADALATTATIMGRGAGEAFVGRFAGAVVSWRQQGLVGERAYGVSWSTSRISSGVLGTTQRNSNGASITS